MSLKSAFQILSSWHKELFFIYYLFLLKILEILYIFQSKLFKYKNKFLFYCVYIKFKIPYHYLLYLREA